MVRVILYAEHLVSALTIPTSAYAHVSAPHLASVITVILNINIVIGEICTALLFGYSLSSGAHRIPCIPIFVNSIIGANVSWWKTATLGTVPFQCYISTGTVPVPPSAEVSTLVAAVSASQIVNTGGVAISISMEEVVIRTESKTKFFFINNLSSGAHRIVGIPISVNPNMGARISRWETAVLGTVPF